MAARATAIEAARREAEATYLVPELFAQRHEAVVQNLWDGLRQSDDASAVLGALKFGSLTVPGLAPVQSLGNQVGWRRGDTNAPQRFTHDVWRKHIARWKSDGWRLDGSEWRHVWFQPGTNGAHSVFAVEFHLEQAAAKRRLIARGDLEIAWVPLADEGTEPEIREARVTSLDVFERVGEPRFELAAREVIAPEQGNIYIDPLLLHDLDGDGRDELILPAKNRAYHNLGRGGFTVGKLAPRADSQLLAALLADVDGDGHADLVAADTAGVIVFRGQGETRFDSPPERQPVADLASPYAFTAGDVDGDGDLDLWLIQYKVPFRFGQMPTPYFDANDGFPSYLLLNDGKGHFTDATQAAGLATKRHRRSYSASFCDLDEDGDLDLVNISDFAGVDLYANDGQGKFTDVTERLGERRLFGMAHALADFDSDGRVDLFAVGMNSAAATRLDALGLTEPGFPQYAAARAPMVYGNRVWLGRDWGRFIAAPWNDAVAAAGWAWGVAAFDLENDGDLDLYVANGHRTRASVKDYDPQFWLHDIYVASSEVNAALDLHFGNAASRHYGAGESYGGHHRNVLFQNDADGSGPGWHNVAWLHGVALPEDCRNVAAVDLDNDGRLDLVTLTEEVWPEERKTLQIYRNRGEAGNWLTVRLREEGSGKSPWGARIVMQAAGRRQVRWLVAGDSYRSQSAPVAHFGLGDAAKVDWVEVWWPGGQHERLEEPEVNTQHLVLFPAVPAELTPAEIEAGFK